MTNMDITDIISGILAGITLLGFLGLGFWWLIKYGIKEAQETRELRKLAKKWLEQHINEDK